MKKIYGIIVAVICMCWLSSCSSITSKVSDTELSQNPVKQEVFNEVNKFFKIGTSLNVGNFVDYYSDNAFISTVSREFTPKSLEAELFKRYREFKEQGKYLSFEIQALDIVNDKVVVRSLNRINKKGSTGARFLRWLVWKKFDSKWKIVSETPYPPEYISEEDRIKHGLDSLT